MIVLVGMIAVVVSLAAVAFHLNNLRKNAEEELARYMALRHAVDVATAADPEERDAILSSASQLADQSAASTKPPQLPLGQVEVRIWICDGSSTENRRQAQMLQKMRPGGATAQWRLDYLSAEANARSNYRLARNEIRYNPEEEDAADKLQQMIQGVELTKVLTFFPTPRSVSVFFCQGAKLLPPRPPQQNPSASL